ncbi:unnamed protein product, partial [Laminaria digitata]
ANAKGSVATSPIPVGSSPSVGSDKALVTIVEFSDFQCPYCSRGASTLEELKKSYSEDELRIVFKHNPLSFHKEADEAARASIAAHKQGHFWRMHDLLFKNQRNFKSAESIDALMEGYAGFIGLDEKTFARDYRDPATQRRIDEDMELGEKVGVRGTPHFFVNGVRLVGAQPAEKFRAVIDAELAASREMIEGGEATRKNIYAVRSAMNFAPPEPKKPSVDAKKFASVKVDVKHDPIKGNNKKALVTIVEFSDFQCPFCKRGAGTMDQITDTYGDDVRLVFKHLPLAFHKQAEPAARAAYAAQQQGKFWQMHDLLFENQQDLKSSDPELWISFANRAGLDVARFEKDFNSSKAKAKVAADLKYAGEVGARGTPNFFVNGIQITGAHPFPKFKALIDEQIVLAKTLKKKDKSLKGEKLYAALLAENKKTAVVVDEPAKPSTPPEKLDAKLYGDLKKRAARAPTRGDIKKARVVIYEFTDLQCPFCKRGHDNLAIIEKEYGKDVAIVSFAFPLPFHKEAEPAHRAALAAGKQGKFFEMSHAIFENQRELRTNPEILIQLANQVGLDIGKF